MLIRWATISYNSRGHHSCCDLGKWSRSVWGSWDTVLDCMFVFPQNSCAEILTTSVMVFEGEALGRSWGWSPHDVVGALIRRVRDQSARSLFLSLSLSLSAMWGYNKKTAVCKPGRELSLEPNCAGFPASRTMSNKCLLGFPDGAVVKNLPANAGDTGSIRGPGRSHMPRSN